MKICKNCGHEISEDAKFCTGCGAKVETEENKQTGKQIVANTGEKGIVAMVVVISLLIVVIILLCLRIFVFDTKKMNKDIEHTETVTTQEATTKQETTEIVTEESTEQPKTTSLFQKMPSEYIFSSGAGGWQTAITIAPDGTFTGSYHQGGGGDRGYYTEYRCEFEGKFSQPEKINDFTYHMYLESLETFGTKDEEIIEDNVHYITSIPYGLEKGKEFMIYLPGTSIEKLPEEFVRWTVYPATGDADASTTDFYGLYNVEPGYGFREYTTVSVESNDYIISDSDSRLLTEDDVEDLTVWEVNYAKNEIYARHGYIFESAELQEYFEDRSWYEPKYEKAEFDRMELLSDVEKKNAAYLSSVEKSMGGYELDK